MGGKKKRKREEVKCKVIRKGGREREEGDVRSNEMSKMERKRSRREETKNSGKGVRKEEMRRKRDGRKIMKTE